MTPTSIDPTGNIRAPCTRTLVSGGTCERVTGSGEVRNSVRAHAARERQHCQPLSLTRGVSRLIARGSADSPSGARWNAGDCAPWPTRGLKPPPGSGSGKFETPWARMHSANRRLAPPPPPPAPAPEPHAARATADAVARVTHSLATLARPLARAPVLARAWGCSATAVRSPIGEPPPLLSDLVFVIRKAVAAIAPTPAPQFPPTRFVIRNVDVEVGRRVLDLRPWPTAHVELAHLCTSHDPHRWGPVRDDRRHGEI